MVFSIYTRKGFRKRIKLLEPFTIFEPRRCRLEPFEPAAGH
jgi:hypothetical protein